METTMLNLRNLFEQLVRRVEILSEGNELQFIQLAKDFEDFRKKWQRTDQELGKYKDLLMKAETERSALDVKLKHARNQVDVEIKRRQRAEADCEKLERQIQLIREMLMCDTSGSIQLSEEQKSALAFLNRGQPSIGNAGNKRLSTIDESGSILSDISFDKTDESLDWDSSVIKTFKLKKREKRRSNSRQFVDGPPGPIKKTRSIGSTADQGNESIVAKTTVTVPSDGGPIEATSTIETVPYWTRSRRKTGTLQPWNSDSTLSSKPLEPRTETDGSSTPQSSGGMRLHDFVSKTVIKPESCVPCGKRIKFGKLSLKCRDCRVVSHPECRDRCPLPCIPTLIGTPVKIGEGILADYVSQTSPMIPSIIVHCVNEIEQRGLTETGLYRVSGCDRTVKELKEKFLRVKTVPLLSKVDDIHAICSFLKDFLRNLKEPLLTFRLNKTFMGAAEITDEDNSIAAMYQAVGELPQANRDTLAFLMIHLQRVAQSPNTKMDIANLAKVFGPTPQSSTIPPILRGRHILCAAETGSGKTLSYLLPLLQQLLGRPSLDSRTPAPRGLVLVPSRELAEQVQAVAQPLGRSLGLRVQELEGGHGMSRITQQLSRQPPADVLVATPGALWKALKRQLINLERLSFLVLDEADTLLDESFLELVEYILGRSNIAEGSDDLKDPFNPKAQLVLVGATFPKGAGQLLSKISNSDSLTTITSSKLHCVMPHVKQTFMRLKGAEKVPELVQILKQHDRADKTGSSGTVLVFCNSSSTVNWLGYILDDHKIQHLRLQGQMPASMRAGIFKSFQKGSRDILLCTDIASRGLDSTQVELVVNYDFPLTLQDYIHRAGRVGRVGSEVPGTVISFVTHPWDVSLVQKIELAARRKRSLPGLGSLENLVPADMNAVS